LNNDGEKPHKCDFWGEYSVMVCNEPAPYKMTYVDAELQVWKADWYCKHHYEIMADVIMKGRDKDNSRQRRQIDRMLEINNWFQHE
jgi:hypothetical protein